jgi:outer membrane lipoprotein SlyB
VRRQLAAVVAVLSIAAACEVDAQISTEPGRDAGMSVVMRCQDCGTIQSIREVQTVRATPSPATDSASPVGLVMSIPLGRKTGTQNAFVGSAGSRQWQERTANARYEFIVRMDDGNYRTVSRQGVSDFTVGDRVKVSQLQIEHWTQ